MMSERSREQIERIYSDVIRRFFTRQSVNYGWERFMFEKLDAPNSLRIGCSAGEKVKRDNLQLIAILVSAPRCLPSPIKLGRLLPVSAMWSNG